MAKKVLVIGGSYFVGRVFTILCNREPGEWELHVVNRGTQPLNYDCVTQYVCDRHDPERMAQILPDIEFDAVVDFCAYFKGEISPIVEKLHDRIKQYIFVSTASVYINDDHAIRKEGDPILYESDDDMVAQYICGKSQLEKELTETCGKYGIPYTIARPAFIYGPFNYAPRESWYIEKIATGKAVVYPVDADARFNFVYVVDVAEALRIFVGDERAFNEIFNISSNEVITNERFLSQLMHCHGKQFELLESTVDEVLEKRIAVPWPLTDDELYDGSKLEEVFGFHYTPFPEGMQKAYRAFMNVYAPQG